jgi:hypothetical protein
VHFVRLADREGRHFQATISKFALLHRFNFGNADDLCDVVVESLNVQALREHRASVATLLSRSCAACRVLAKKNFLLGWRKIAPRC